MLITPYSIFIRVIGRDELCLKTTSKSNWKYRTGKSPQTDFKKILEGYKNGIFKRALGFSYISKETVAGTNNYHINDIWWFVDISSRISCGTICLHVVLG